MDIQKQIELAKAAATMHCALETTEGWSVEQLQRIKNFFEFADKQDVPASAEEVVENILQSYGF